MNDSKKLPLFLVLLGLFISYSFFLYYKQPVEVKSLAEEVEAGRSTWQEYNCNACHQIYGQGGFLGPDLTNCYTKRGENYINAFLMGGTAVMPNFNLSEKQRAELMAYLRAVDQSGSADPKTFKIYANGTIEQ